MTAIGPAPVPTPPPMRGRGLIRAGWVLIAIAVVLGAVGVGVLASRVDLNEFTRDVVLDSDSPAEVPGDIDFRVARPIHGDDAERMRVGVGVDSGSFATTTCTITGAGVDAVQGGGNDDQFIDGRDGYEVVASALLEPGSYTASCEPAPGAADASTGRFVVGRTVSGDDLFGLFGPILGIVAVGVVASFVLMVGVGLLIAGYVVRSRARRPPSPPSWPTPPPWEPPPYRPSPYRPSPYRPPDDS